MQKIIFYYWRNSKIPQVPSSEFVDSIKNKDKRRKSEYSRIFIRYNFSLWRIYTHTWPPECSGAETNMSSSVLLTNMSSSVLFTNMSSSVLFTNMSSSVPSPILATWGRRGGGLEREIKKMGNFYFLKIGCREKVCKK